MDPDLVGLLGGDPSNPVGSLAEAIRRKRALGMLGMGTGDPAMAGLGKELTGETHQDVQTIMQDKHLGIQQQQMMDLLRHRQVEEGQGQARVDQGDARIEAMNKALALRGIRWNQNSGTFENVAPMAKPSRPTALPLSTGGAGPQGGGMPQPAAGAPLGQPAAPQGVPEVIGKWQDKALKDLGADFNPSSGRSGEFGKNQQRVNAAKRLLTLALDEQGQPRNLTPNQMPELAQNLASLIGGSSGAQSQIEHLTPQSLRGDFSKIAQWVTNEPQGADQQAFVKNMADTAQRERDVAQQGIDQVRGQLVAKHQRILKSNPIAAKRVLNGFGWDLGPDGMPVQMNTAPPAATAKPVAKATHRFNADTGKIEAIP